MLLLILLFHFLLFGYSSSDDKLCGIDSFIDLSLNDIDIEEVLYDRKSEGTLANLKCDGDPKVLEYFNVTAYDTDFLIQSTAKLADVDINTKKQKESMVSFTVDCNMTCNGNSIKVGIQFIVFDTNNHAPQFLKKEYIYRVASPIMPFGDFTDFGEKLIAEDIDFSNQGMTFTVDPDDFIVTTVVDEKQYTASFSAKKIIQITNPLTYKIVATDKGNEKTLSTSTEVTVQVDPSKSLDTPSFQNPSYSFDYSVKNKIVTLTPRNGPIKLTTNKPSEVIHLSLTGAYRENFAAKFNTKDNTVKLTATPISSDSSFTILTLSAETDAVASTSIVVYLTPAEESTPKFSNHFYSGSYTTNNTIVLDQKIVATAKKGTPIVTLAGDFSDHFKIDLTNGSYTITVSKKLTGSDVKSLTHLTFTLTATLAEITDQAALIIKLPEHQLLFTNNLYDATYDADANTLSLDDKNPIAFTTAVKLTSIKIDGSYSKNFNVTYNETSKTCEVSIVTPLPESTASQNVITLTIIARDSYEFEAWTILKITKIVKEPPQFSRSVYKAEYPKLGSGYFDFDTSIEFVNVVDIEKVTIVVAGYQDNFEVARVSNKWQLNIKKPLDDSILEKELPIVTTLNATEEGNDLIGSSVLVVELPKIPREGPEFSESFYTAVYPKNGTGVIELPLSFKNVDEVYIEITLNNYAENFLVQKSNGKWQIKILKVLDEITLKQKELVITMTATAAGFKNTGISILVLQLPEQDKKEGPIFSEDYYMANYLESKTGLIDFSSEITFINIKDVGKVTIQVKGYEKNFDVVHQSNKWQLKIKNPLNESTLEEKSPIVTNLEATEEGNNLTGSSVFLLELPKEKTEDKPEFSEPFYIVDYPKTGSGIIEFEKPLIFRNVDDKVDVKIELNKYTDNFIVEKVNEKWQVKIKKSLDETTLKEKELVITMTASAVGFKNTGVSVLVMKLPEDDTKKEGPAFSENYYTADYPKNGTGLIEFKPNINFTNVKDFTKVTIVVSDYTENFDVILDSGKWHLKIKKPLDDSILKDKLPLIASLVATEQGNDVKGSTVLVLELPKSDGDEDAPEFTENFYIVTYPKNGKGVIEFGNPLKFNNLDEKYDIKIELSAYSENFRFEKSSGNWQIQIQKPLNESVLKANNELVLTMIASGANFTKTGISILVLELPNDEVDSKAPEFSDVTYTAEYPIKGTGIIDFNQDVKFNKISDVSDISIEISDYNGITNFGIEYNASLKKWQIQILIPLSKTALDAMSFIDLTLAAKKKDIDGSGKATLIINLPPRTPTEEPKFSKGVYSATYQYISGIPSVTLIDEISITNKLDLNQISIVADEYSSNFDLISRYNTWFVNVKSPLDEAILKTRTNLAVSIKATDQSNGLSDFSVIELKLPPVNSEDAPKFSKTFYTAEYTLPDGKGLVTLDEPLEIINRETADNIKIVTDSDIIDYNNYFNVLYDNATKKWNINVIKNLDGSMLKSNVVIDMDLTAADISSNSSSIGRAGLVLKLPPVNSKEAPNFSKLVYQAEYNSKTTVLNTDIKITNKKDSDNVIVTIDQDFQRYFSISLNKKTSMWEVTVITLPDSVTRDKQNLVITLTATQTGNTAVGKSTLLVTLPEKNPPQFSKAFYKGSYKIDDGTAKLTMEDFVITNREHSENLLLGIGVFEKNLGYHYDHNKNVWSLNLLAPFSEEQLDNKTEFILTLTAEDTEEGSFGRATVIIYLPAKNNPKPVLEFSQFSYEGTYNETEGKPIVNLEKTIEITSKADLKNVQVTLQSPDSFDKYFTLKEESIGHYQIHVTTPLPQSVLEDRTSLILTLEADLDGYKTHATLVINLPAIVINRDIHFSKIVYNGTYKVADGNTTFTVEPIQVTTSAPVEEVFVMISSDPAYKEYFVAQYINKQVVIKSKTELPEKILKTVSLIPLTLEIAIIGKPDRANAVVNIEISYNNPDDKSTISFSKNYYEGRYNRGQSIISADDIFISTNQIDGNIEVSIKNEYSDYFTLSYSNKYITIKEGPDVLKPDIILTIIPLVLEARIKNTVHTANAVLNLIVEDVYDDTTKLTFQDVLYTGFYSIENGKINFKVKEKIQVITDILDENIESPLTIESEYAKYFEATYASKTVTVTPLHQIPDDILKGVSTIALKLVITTKDSKKSSSAVLNIAVNGEPDVDTRSIEFSDLLYYGTYDINGSSPVIQHDKISLFTDQEDKNILVEITNGFKEYFSANYSKEYVSISVTKPIPANISNTLYVIPITLEASIVNSSKSSSAVLNLKIIDDSHDTTTLSFAEVLYTGNYSNENGKINFNVKEKIQVITDILDKNIESPLTIDSEYAKYFEATYASKTVTVTPLHQIPDDILKGVSTITLKLVITTKDSKMSSSAVLNIAVNGEPDIETGYVEFSNVFYSGTYDMKGSSPVIKYDNISLTTDQEDENILVEITNGFKEYFAANCSKKSVSISVTKPIPADIQNTLNVIPIILKANIVDSNKSSSAVLNLKIIDDSHETTTLTFANVLYTGNYSIENGKINFIVKEEIKVITDILEENIKSPLTIDSEYAKYFEATYASNTVTVTLLNQIPDDILKSVSTITLKLVITTKDSKTSSSAVLNIAVNGEPDVDTGSVKFSSLLYSGTYDMKGSSPVIKHDEISLITDQEDENISVEITNGFKEYFAVSYSMKSVVISITKQIPADIQNASNVLTITLEASVVGSSKSSSAVLNLKIIDNDDDNTGFVLFDKILHTGEYSVINGFGKLTVDGNIQVMTDRADNEIEINISNEYSLYFVPKYSSKEVSMELKSNLPDEIFNNNFYIPLTLIASIKSTNKSSSTVLNIKLNNERSDNIKLAFTSFIYNGEYLVEDGNASLHYDPIYLDTDQEDDVIDISVENEYATYFSTNYSNKVVKIDLTNTVASETLQNLSNIPVELKVQIVNTTHSAFAVLNLRVKGENNTDNTDTIAFEKILYSGVYSVGEKIEEPKFKVDEIKVITQNMASDIDITTKNDYHFDQYFKFSYNNNIISVAVIKAIPKDILKKNKFIPITLKVTLKSSGRSASTVLNIQVDYNNDDENKESSVDTTGYIAAVIVLGLILLALIAGAVAFYYFRVRNKKNLQMDEEEYYRMRYDRQSKSRPSSKMGSSSLEERRPTGFIFSPNEDLSRRETSTDPPDRRKSVAFNDNVERLEIDGVNDEDINNALKDKPEVTSL